MNVGWGLVSFLLIVGIMVLAKAFFAGTPIAKRPNRKGTDGFPSGHAAVASGIATIAFLMGVPLWIVFILVLVALAVSWQRVASKAHTETQVVVGDLLGILVPVAIWLTTT